MAYFYRSYRRQLYKKSSRFDSIDDDLIEIFFNLTSSQLEELFTIYGRKHGFSSANYARKTYSKWKNNTVKQSRQSIARILVSLPEISDFQIKCTIIKKLRKKYFRKEFYKINIDTNNWVEKVTPLVDEVINKARTIELPEVVERHLFWLANDDMQIANAIIGQIEVEEGKIAVALLKEEFEKIEYLLESLPVKATVTHTIILPYGNIELNIKKVKTMSDDNNVIPKNQSLFKPTIDDVLTNALANLDEQQAKSLHHQAAQEALKLSVNKQHSLQKNENASQSMRDFIHRANELDKGSMGRDYSMQGTYEGASGTTQVTISKQTNMTTIVIMVVIGIILILFFLTRN